MGIHLRTAQTQNHSAYITPFYSRQPLTATLSPHPAHRQSIIGAPVRIIALLRVFTALKNCAELVYFEHWTRQKRKESKQIEGLGWLLTILPSRTGLDEVFFSFEPGYFSSSYPEGLKDTFVPLHESMQRIQLGTALHIDVQYLAPPQAAIQSQPSNTQALH